MTVALWQHILVVLALLSTNATTFFVCKHRIEALKGALLAKRVLLNEGPEAMVGRSYPMVAGDSLDMRKLGLPITIETSQATTLKVKG